MVRRARLETVDQMVDAVRSLADAFTRENANDSAQAIDAALGGSYTTSTEALIALMDGLSEIGAKAAAKHARQMGQSYSRLSGRRKDSRAVTELRLVAVVGAPTGADVTHGLRSS